MTPGHLFRNLHPQPPHGLLEILRWKAGFPPYEKPRISDAPDTPAPVVFLDVSMIATPPAHGWRVTWLGHSSFLLQGSGLSLLMDPVFSTYCAPFPLPGLRRLRELPCSLRDLPPIDAVLISHSHYDHLDLPTLRLLGKHTRLIVPEGHAKWLGRSGFTNVIEIPWFSSHELAPGVTITSTSARHFTARSLWDRDRAHWCGWLIKGADRSIWHAGDSGYCEGFQEIGERLGPIDFGMIPIGAYQPRRIMRPIHMDPEEAVQVFLDTRCRRAVAMHWGTFRLTDEPLSEPPILLARALDAHDLNKESFIAGAIGQSWTV